MNRPPDPEPGTAAELATDAEPAPDDEIISEVPDLDGLTLEEIAALLADPDSPTSRYLARILRELDEFPPTDGCPC